MTAAQSPRFLAQRVRRAVKLRRRHSYMSDAETSTGSARLREVACQNPHYGRALPSERICNDGSSGARFRRDATQANSPAS